MAVINIDNIPYCSHGSHTCGAICSAYDPKKPTRWFCGECIPRTEYANEFAWRQHIETFHKAGNK